MVGGKGTTSMLGKEIVVKKPFTNALNPNKDNLERCSVFYIPKLSKSYSVIPISHSNINSIAPSFMTSFVWTDKSSWTHVAQNENQKPRIFFNSPTSVVSRWPHIVDAQALKRNIIAAIIPWPRHLNGASYMDCKTMGRLECRGGFGRKRCWLWA